MKHRAKWVGLLVFQMGVLYGVEARTQVLSADEIAERMLKKNAERAAALDHYESDRVYRVDYKGTGGARAGEMRVHVVYKSPSEKRFTVISESGSKLICERVLRKMVASEEEASQRANRMQMELSPANYAMRLLGEEDMDGVPSWVLEVTPKVSDKFAYRGKVWVSVEDYGVVRVLGQPAKNPSWLISRASFDYHYFRTGGFWLPAKNVSTSHVRIGGEATLTIDYGHYLVVPVKRAGADPTEDTGDRGR